MRPSRARPGRASGSDRGITAAWVALAVGLAAPAWAQSMAWGQGMLTYANQYLIGPLGVLSVVVALAASIFRPDLVRSAIYSAVICALIFFIIRASGAILGAMQS